MAPTLLTPLLAATALLPPHTPLSRQRMQQIHHRQQFSASTPPTLLNRRSCLALVPAFSSLSLLVQPLPAHAADEVLTLQKALFFLDDLVARWPEVTIDCRFGEINRAILSDDNKEALLDAASSTSKAATMVTKCKTTGSVVRQYLGTSGDAPTPLANIGKLLEKPSLVQLVPDDSFEAFLQSSEKLQLALAAADASAFLASSDYSAKTTFRKGEPTTTPNLDDAKASIEAARKELALLVQLTSPPPPSPPPVEPSGGG